MPTIPALTLSWNARAAFPSRVKIAAPFPGVGVDELDRLVQRVRPDDDEHRPEDLLAIHAHLGADVVEQARTDEEAALVAVDGDLAAVADQLGALVDAGVDEALDAVARGRADQRPDL